MHGRRDLTVSVCDDSQKQTDESQIVQKYWTLETHFKLTRMEEVLNLIQIHHLS